MKFRDLLNKAVQMHGSQGNLASHIGIDQGDLSRIIYGDKGIKAEHIDKILAAADMIIVSRDRMVKVMTAYDLVHELYIEERNARRPD